MKLRDGAVKEQATLEAVARSRSAAVFALEKMALLSSFAKRKNGFCATFEKNFVMNFVKFGSTPSGAGPAYQYLDLPKF